ncbi:hypothetical protein niasHS_006127 [Heterodera schachtii]|uniref:Uncharacterized protein n=2 Tax=Heterodera TaxID=34509 RepID=A0ABD2K889_9BILA
MAANSDAVNDDADAEHQFEVKIPELSLGASFYAPTRAALVGGFGNYIVVACISVFFLAFIGVYMAFFKPEKRRRGR